MLNRLKEIDRQIKFVEQILKKEEYLAAWLYNSRKYNVDFLRMAIQQASDYFNSTTKEDE